MKDEIEAICAIYARLGSELIRIGLINEDWTAKKPKKDWTLDDEEVVSLYKTLSSLVTYVSIDFIRKSADKMNSIIAELPDKKAMSNEILLTVDMFNEVCMKSRNSFELKSWRGRSFRLSKSIIDKVSKTSGKDTASMSAMQANNIINAMDGKPMLSKDQRLAIVEKYKARVRDQS